MASASEAARAAGTHVYVAVDAHYPTGVRFAVAPEGAATAAFDATTSTLHVVHAASAAGQQVTVSVSAK